MVVSVFPLYSPTRVFFSTLSPRMTEYVSLVRDPSMSFQDLVYRRRWYLSRPRSTTGTLPSVDWGDIFRSSGSGGSD